MNLRIVSRLLSFVCIVAILLFSSCALSECFFNLSKINLFKWATCLAISVIFYFLFKTFSKNASQKFSHREALATVGLSWILIVLLGTLPYLLFAKNCSFVNAIFESTSGFTSTGATVFSKLHRFDKGLMFYRCLTQWIGGIGIVVFFILFIPFLGAGAKFLRQNEMSTRCSDINFFAMSNLAKKLLQIYSIISAVCFILYFLGGMDLFNAMCHTFTTVSTGGFSTSDLSFAAFNSVFLKITAIIFMTLGGMNFIIFIHLARKEFKEILVNDEFKFYLLIVISYTLFIASLLWFSMGRSPFSSCLLDSCFNIVSIMTSTGFGSSNYDMWLPACHVLLITVMIIGGCTGSTSGGLKVSRIVIAGKICFNELETAFHPTLVKPIFFNNRPLDANEISSTLTYIVLYGAVSFVGILLFVIFQHDVSFMGSISSVFACLNNAGLGLHEVGPNGNYSGLAPITKLLLSIIMLIGRVEFYAIAVLFTPKFWRKTF